MTLGFVSAVFDNIPLTKLALTQGGYDWGALGYSVGFGWHPPAPHKTAPAAAHGEVRP